MLASKQARWRAIIIVLLAILIFTATAPVSAQAQGGWRGEYFNNMTLSGTPALVRVDQSISFDWGTGSPEWGVIGADKFSVRWTGNINVTPGRYRFIMSSDDGARLWINGQLMIDKWLDQQGGYHEITVDLPTGSAYVQMEYYENEGGAKALLAYMRPDGNPGGGGPWVGEYFNNRNLSAPASLVRNEADINFNWGQGSPAAGTINADNFSARWTRNLDLVPGRYQFAVTVDDGVRLWVNHQLIIDQWRDQPPSTHRSDIDLAGGTVHVRMEYYDSVGGAQAQLTWMLISSGGNPAPGLWRAEYFNNISLSGSPSLVRDEAQPNYNWGHGSPAPGIVNNDSFSARWTRTLDFIPGRYRFTATTDDGVRLWVNNQLIINNWRNQATQSVSGDIDLAGGMVSVRMEYYDAGATAEARLSWQRTGAAPSTGGAQTATVASSRVNVRQGPGTSHAIITQLTRGQTLQLAGFRNFDGTWVKVVLSDGRQGWSFAAFLQSSVSISSLPVEGGQPAPSTGVTATVARAANVNVRSGPGVTNSILTAVPQGTIVELLGRNLASSWAKIRLSSGTVGWMNVTYLNSTTAISTLPVVG